MNEQSDTISVGDWVAKRATGELLSDVRVERLEPKAMDLLFLLATRAGEAFSKDAIMEALWPDVVVGDDTLARTISRLRRALGDDAKSPTYIETLHKRGYRLIAPVGVPQIVAAHVAASAEAPRRRHWLPTSIAAGLVLLIVAAGALRFAELPSATAGPRALSERAADFYFQYTRADNEAALALFQSILVNYPDYAPALAGVANALVQKVVRWPDTVGGVSYGKLGDALRGGAMKTPEAKRLLARADQLAAHAVELAPEDAGALKALGFVLAAEGQFDAAIAAYQKAVEVDHDAWGPLINIGDVLEISGRPQLALRYFEAAYAAMTRVYDRQSARVRPWHAELGTLIGDRYRDRGDSTSALSWYRRVLMTAPLNVAATTRLAATLRKLGDTTGADAVCRDLAARLKTTGCGS